MKLKKRLYPGLILACLSTFGCRQTDASVGTGESIMEVAQYPNHQTEPAAETAVYICKSNGAKRYHYSQECGGLKKCKHTVEKVTRKQAEAIGLTPCGFKVCRE